MSDVVENAERAALRGIAHLLPERSGRSSS